MLVVIAKFGAKIKFLILPLIKFLPVLLKTGGTMVLSVGVYAMQWGWKFALGFVLLIFVPPLRSFVGGPAVRFKSGRAGVYPVSWGFIG